MNGLIHLQHAYGGGMGTRSSGGTISGAGLHLPMAADPGALAGNLLACQHAILAQLLTCYIYLRATAAHMLQLLTCCTCSIAHIQSLLT